MPTEISSLYALMMGIVAAITSAKGWEFWLRRIELSDNNIQKELMEKNLFRDDLMVRVGVLQEKLDESNAQMLLVSSKLNELSVNLARAEVRIEFLEQENKELKYKNVQLIEEHVVET